MRLIVQWCAYEYCNLVHYDCSWSSGAENTRVRVAYIDVLVLDISQQGDLELHLVCGYRTNLKNVFTACDHDLPGSQNQIFPYVFHLRSIQNSKISLSLILVIRDILYESVLFSWIMTKQLYIFHWIYYFACVLNSYEWKKFAKLLKIQVDEI